VLTDATGAFIKDHEVRLNPSDWQFEAFTDLTGYLSWHVAPDRRREDEARIVTEVGEWIGAQVLGPVAQALLKKRPATATVTVPDNARDLLFRPLELAHADGKPLSVQDVTLVMQPAGTVPAAPAPASGRLRVLGLFSLPEGGQPLNLRRERHSLVQLVQRIHAQGKAAEVRVLQYGVTRDRLRDVLEEAEGWDIIHISGHGAPGELLLETPAGKPDRVSAADLADLLDLARESVKLVTVAACWSAATTANQQRLLLGLPIRDLNSDTERARHLATPADSAPLATELASRLNCAVLAMRYPLDDEFAIELTTRLYELLADKGQPLPRAVGMTLRRLSADPQFPPLSVATPALFGQAASLRLAAPKRLGSDDYDPSQLKMSGFPPQPDRFVGRVGVMTRASAALAAASGTPGLLLHGMPGGGKTACALELAYTHEHAFRDLIWYKAPDEGADITGSLTDFALTLERYLPGFQMAHLVHDAKQLVPFLPKLTELLQRRRLLVVIDNAESLLTDSGTWRDDNWGRVIGALTGHKGLGRLMLTSRRVPAGLAGPRVEAVDALSPDEALLLARELPKLRRLIYDELPGIDRDDSRRLAVGVLNVAQGHPKLLELADGQASHPDRLAVLVAAGDRAWREQGGLPDGFFATGDAATSRGSAASTGDHWHVLAAWTNAVADTLSPGERDLFWFLCCLEEADREDWILAYTWSDSWPRLGRDGEPPDIGEALTAVAATGLVAIRPRANAASTWYAIHPGVGEAGRAQAGIPFQDAADAGAVAFWASVFRRASGHAGGTVHTGLTVRAGLAAVPYLLRQQQWELAARLLDAAFQQDPSHANAAAMLPAITHATRHDPDRADALARVLHVLDPAAAQKVMRDYLATAITGGNYSSASRAAGWLMNSCLSSGRLTEALDLADQAITYTLQAGLGPWTKLLAEVQRLQVLGALGQAGTVLAEVTRLRGHLDTLPATAGPSEAAIPWNVRELLLDTGRSAALQLRRWDDALNLSAAIVVSERDRHAPASETARTRFNDYTPLLRLGRTDQALALLQDCLKVFQESRDPRLIGKTLCALADAEEKRGHGEAAIRLAHDALRHSYLAEDVSAIVVTYHNLGLYLARRARQPAPALASQLATALIRALTGFDGAINPLGAAAINLRELGTAAVPPTSVAELDRQLGDIPGTDLPGLIAKLAPDPETAEQALRDLIAQAQELAAGPEAPAPLSWSFLLLRKLFTAPTGRGFRGSKSLR
jgi:tetratricopeptide (TPR) repeat protein